MSKDDIPENGSPPGHDGAAQEQEEFHDGDERTPLKDPNDLDDVKVGYKPDGASPDDIEMQLKKEKEPFRCLTKEELEAYTSNKKWKTARIVMFVLFWVGWIGMLAAAIIIIVLAPKCPEKPEIDWWQKNSMYYIWPRSFKDTDGSGVGDINGIKDSLSYFDDEHRALNIGPIFASPLKDSGFDVSDFKSVDPALGSVGDVEALTKAAHKNGLKVVLDLPPNESSDKHEWFIKSQKKEAPYTDYYVWSPTKPSWLDADSQPMWTLDSVRGEYYLHHVDSSMPDLNYNNPAVVDAMKDVLQFWIDKGVDGFNMRNAEYLVDVVTDTAATMHHNKTFEVLNAFKDVLKDNEKGWGNEKMLMVQLGDSSALTAQQLGLYNGVADMVVSDTLRPSAACGAECLQEKIAEWQAISGGSWTLWTLGGADEPRLANQAPDTAAIMNIVGVLMRGTLRTYYGEEIGMEDVNVPFERAQDGLYSDNLVEYQGKGRDKHRTPMQWSTRENAGFSAAESNDTYLPVAENYRSISVKGELASGAGFSGLEAYRAAVKLRSEEPSFMWGDMKVAVDRGVLVLKRSAKGFKGYMIAANLGPTSIDFTPGDSLDLPDKGVAVMSFPEQQHKDFKAGNPLDFRPIRLAGHTVLVASFD